MRNRVPISLEPLGQTLQVERGTSLQDVLFSYGVEFPCGGQGRCRGCRVRLLEGSAPITPEQEEILSPEELADGWRLACQCVAESPVTLQVAQWETAILTDHAAFSFTPREGWGIAIDLGTTTVVAQLVDLQTGRVLGVRTGLNPQARHGADVMSRIQFALVEEGRAELVDLIRSKIGSLIRRLLASVQCEEAPFQSVVVVGNTVMHHLLGGFDLEPLSRWPFETKADGAHAIPASELGWELRGDPLVRLLPCLGGFVGSDILAGVLATEMHRSDSLVALVDLGTNGEIALGNRERILCASTAAGPAFEGGGISMGMQATTGAITAVKFKKGELHCRVQGEVAARGICGSGLVDAIAVGLELGFIEPSGRLSGDSNPYQLGPGVSLTQRDVRQLQLAKGAISAGIRILLERWDAEPRDLSRVHLAGAFGNYVDPASARRVGLIDFPDETVAPAGNTALLGAKIALFADDSDAGGLDALRDRIDHVPLAADPQFQEIFIDSMAFPAGRPAGADPSPSR
jgi:uncharacterized 2Fe-2S/4Fe-4S cluster protein (DUF4445 family)